MRAVIDGYRGHRAESLEARGHSVRQYSARGVRLMIRCDGISLQADSENRMARATSMINRERKDVSVLKHTNKRIVPAVIVHCAQTEGWPMIEDRGGAWRRPTRTPDRPILRSDSDRREIDIS